MKLFPYFIFVMQLLKGQLVISANRISNFVLNDSSYETLL